MIIKGQSLIKSLQDQNKLLEIQKFQNKAKKIMDWIFSFRIKMYRKLIFRGLLPYRTTIGHKIDRINKNPEEKPKVPPDFIMKKGSEYVMPSERKKSSYKDWHKNGPLAR